MKSWFKLYTKLRRHKYKIIGTGLLAYEIYRINNNLKDLPDLVFDLDNTLIHSKIKHRYYDENNSIFPEPDYMLEDEPKTTKESSIQQRSNPVEYIKRIYNSYYKSGLSVNSKDDLDDDDDDDDLDDDDDDDLDDDLDDDDDDDDDEDENDGESSSGYVVFMRPYARVVLSALSLAFKLHIHTSADRQYCGEILQNVFPNIKFQTVTTRQDYDDTLGKDTSKIFNKTLLIDDKIYNRVKSQDFYHIPPFKYYNQSDKELLKFCLFVLVKYIL